MDIIALKEKLQNNPCDVEKVLLRLGFDAENLVYHENRDFFTCTRPCEDADNKRGFILHLNTLNYQYTTRSGSGNIFTLVMDIKNVKFPRALQLIAKWIGFEDRGHVRVELPFHGFYKKYIVEDETPELALKSYQESDLPASNSLSKKYLDDGVSLQTQEKFGVRYSHKDDCIITPIYSLDNKLIGAKARANSDIDYSKRFWATIPYQKTMTIFGFGVNYKSMIKKSTAIIFEAEKSVMQCSSFDCNCAIAIGGKNISEVQAKYIKSLMVDRIIVAFDEGVSKEEIEYETKKLVSNNSIYKNKVYYIWDENHKYLAKDGRASPSDYGREKLNRLIKECLVQVG